ncbi:hypothetical protein QYE76_029524 [Lolium multiflorum]|uniref:Uncharacterized protein n=1 Tax=Lolium multiflorum TaxID=4521 RepID=A0AAD8QMZ4_LOLMU|nr:hypothetical protein QYE76_029524 [Lolium multiflorum]
MEKQKEMGEDYTGHPSAAAVRYDRRNLLVHSSARGGYPGPDPVLRQQHTARQMEPYVQTETYDLENGGSIHWVDGLAHALREGLARVCGQNIAALRGSRFAHFARHDTMGEPMALSSHPVLKIHVQHLDFMLHETRKELTRVHAHRAQMALAHHADAIRMLAKDRKSLRCSAKKDATISRLHEKIRTLEVTIRTQQDQIQEMEEDGEDIQGGDDFLSDDNDFEDDEFTDEEDYAFLESEEDGIIPIDVDEEDEE